MKHVYMIAPSYRPEPESVEMTRAYFENQGFKVTIPEDLLGMIFCVPIRMRSGWHI